MFDRLVNPLQSMTIKCKTWIVTYLSVNKHQYKIKIRKDRLKQQNLFINRMVIRSYRYCNNIYAVLFTLLIHDAIEICSHYFYIYIYFHLYMVV